MIHSRDFHFYRFFVVNYIFFYRVNSSFLNYSNVSMSLAFWIVMISGWFSNNYDFGVEGALHLFFFFFLRFFCMFISSNR